MRNVVVTGGSRGLGLGIARALARRLPVIAIARKESKQPAAALAEAERGSPHFVATHWPSTRPQSRNGHESTTVRARAPLLLPDVASSGAAIGGDRLDCFMTSRRLSSGRELLTNFGEYPISKNPQNLHKDN